MLELGEDRRHQHDAHGQEHFDDSDAIRAAADRLQARACARAARHRRQFT